MRQSTTHRTLARLVGATLVASALAASLIPSASAEDNAPSGVSESPGVVNINTATAEELQLLPGVGPARANAIIAQREQRPFARVEEIMRVKGIGRATFRTLRPLVTVEGPTTLRQTPTRSASAE